MAKERPFLWKPDQAPQNVEDIVREYEAVNLDFDDLEAMLITYIEDDAIKRGTESSTDIASRIMTPVRKQFIAYRCIPKDDVQKILHSPMMQRIVIRGLNIVGYPILHEVVKELTKKPSLK